VRAEAQALVHVEGVVDRVIRSRRRLQFTPKEDV